MITDPQQAHYLTKEECREKTDALTRVQVANPDYMIELKFIRDDDGWYADVPTHTRSQNAMVCGSDTMLNALANGKNEIVVKFRFIESATHRPIATLKRLTDSHSLGATYMAHGISRIPFPCYICPVGHDVYGTAPKKIFIYEVL